MEHDAAQVVSARSSRRFAVLLGVVVAAVYWVTRSAYQTGDSLDYASSIRSGNGLFHPHHLLFSPSVYVVRGLTGLDALSAAQVHNISWAVVGVLLFARVAVELLGVSRGRAAAILTAASLGPWSFATQCEVYVPALSCSLATFWLLLGPRLHLVPAAVFLALATLYHQTGVLSVIPAAALVVTAGSGRSVSRKASAVALLTGLAGLLSLGTYAAVYLGSGHEPVLRAFVDFCLHYAGESGRPGWGTFDNVGPKGLYLLAHSQLRGLVALPKDEFSTISIVATFGAACAAVPILWRAAVQGGRRFAVVAGAWAVPYWLFGLWWLPREEEFLLVAVPVVCGSLAVVFGSVRREWLLWGIVTSLGLTNLSVEVWPNAWDRGAHYEVAASLADLDDYPGSLVLARHETVANLGFHFPQKVDLRPTDAVFLDLYAGRDPGPPGPQHFDTVLVPLELLDPDWPTWFYDPRRDREGWRRLIRWVADVDAHTSTYGALDGVETVSGTVLRVRPQARRRGVFEAVMSRFDAIDGRPGRFAALVEER